MQVEDRLEMVASLRVFKLPNFEARGELALGFWRHISPHVAYKKLMLQGYFLAWDHFYIFDKFVHGPTEKDEVYLRSYVSQLVRGMFEMNCLLSSSSISTWGMVKTNTYLYRVIQYLHNGV